MLASLFKIYVSKSQNKVDLSNYKKQQNFSKNLLKENRQNYFGYLNMKSLNRNRKFQNIIKLFFSFEGMNSDKMIIEKNKILSEGIPNLEVMKNYILAFRKF